MQNIKFEDRAVAFVDVLGFKKVVDLASQGGNMHTELEDLIDTLESAVPKLDGTVDKSIPRSLIPMHIYISDSIIMSAPLTSSEVQGYHGLSVLVMRVIQISHILLSKGYLLRGGISIGSVWHTPSNIVGTAYQEAHQIEMETCAPRIELSQSAKNHWESIEGGSNAMCLDYRNHFMVNVLHDYYIRDDSHGAAERAFENYSRIIEGNLNANLSESARYKWWWFMEFLKSEVARNSYIFHK